MKKAVVYVGVDVAKNHLDVSWGKQSRRLPNQKVAHHTLVAELKASGQPMQVICEASGGYEQALVHALQRAGQLVSIVPANRVHKSAQAAGILAKTDRIDARVLSAFGAPRCNRWRPHLSQSDTATCANWKPNAGNSLNY